MVCDLRSNSGLVELRVRVQHLHDVEDASHVHLGNLKVSLVFFCCRLRCTPATLGSRDALRATLNRTGLSAFTQSGSQLATCQQWLLIPGCPGRL